jgi:hypothetical protein
VVLVLGSLSASAGVVTAVALLAGAIGGSARRWGVAVGLAAAANAPWVVAGLLHAGSATTATDGAAPFALQAEGGIPAPVAAISLGGIWNGDVVPGSRTGLAGWLTAAAVVVLAALGLRVWRTTLGRPLARALGTCWVVGMGVALLTWALPDAVGWFASYVPGGGVVRDGARMLVLAAPAVATLVGAGVAAVVARVEAGPPRLLIGAGLVLLPVLLLVDASWGIGGRLTAVTYPDSYETMRTAVSAGPPGDVLVLPFTSFRRPEWNNSHVVLDPVGRYQPRNYLSSDVLIVGGTAIPGEDPRVARASEALAMSTPAERSGALAELGISIVVTDRSALGPAPEVAGRLLTPTGAEVTAVALEGRVRERPVPSGWYAALGVAWGSFVATAVVLPAILVWWRRRRRSSDRPS